MAVVADFDLVAEVSQALEELTATGVDERIEFLGRVSFEAARTRQEEILARRIAGEISDRLILCEHPPTLSLGRRTLEQDLQEAPEYWTDRGYTLVQADRGGGPTYHGPGQLMIYPVVSLRERNIGVRDFVLQGLSTLQEALAKLGVQSRVKFDPAGLWIERDAHCKLDRKIAAVGLRIQRGVSNHGFSLNVAVDENAFTGFSACGLVDVGVANLLSELPESIKTSKSRIFPLVDSLYHYIAL